MELTEAIRHAITALNYRAAELTLAAPLLDESVGTIDAASDRLTRFLKGLEDDSGVEDTEPEGQECEECGEYIEDGDPSLVSFDHLDSCSLWPTIYDIRDSS